MQSPADRAGGARVTVGLAALVIVIVAGLRWTTWNDHILFIDEAIYYSFAARLELPGAHVYTHTADQKPPLGPLTYWLAIQVSPAHAITVAHVATTIAIAATGVLLVAASHALCGTPWAGFVAAVLYALIGSGMAAASEPFFAFSGLEHFQAPWLMACVSAFLLSLRRQHLGLAVVAGFTLGVAALYKQNVPVLLAAAWLVAAWAAWRGRLRFRRAAVLAVACAATTVVVIVAVPVYYAAIGHFAAWRLYNIEVLSAYHGMAGTLPTEARLLGRLVPVPALSVVAVLFAVAMFVVDRSAWMAETVAFLVLGWVTLFVSVLPGLHKGHYLIQGLPLQCLLVGILVVEAARRAWGARQPRRVGLMGLYLVAVIAPLVSALYGLGRDWITLRGVIADDAYLAIHRAAGTLDPVVDYIRNHVAPNELIYVHSEAPEFYFLTQRRPAASDPTGSWIALLPSDATANRLLADLQATPPRLILQFGYRRYGREREVMQKWPQLRAWLQEHYQLMGGLNYTQIFVRRD